MAFVKDLKDGEEIEAEILAILKKKFPHARKETGRYCREFYDLLIPYERDQPEIKIEVKADLYASANFAFECLGRNFKSTGIIKTTAKYWLHYRKENYYLWLTGPLRHYLLNLGGCLRDCGDDKVSSAWIVPETKILEEFKPLAIVPRNSEELNQYI